MLLPQRLTYWQSDARVRGSYIVRVSVASGRSYGYSTSLTESRQAVTSNSTSASYQSAFWWLARSSASMRLDAREYSVSQSMRT
jgi:hypothetical protein